MDFIRTAEADLKTVGQDIEKIGERIADTVFGAGTTSKIETELGAGVKTAEDMAAIALSALKAFGVGHIALLQLSPTAELEAIKAKVEDAIVTLTRHIAAL